MNITYKCQGNVIAGAGVGSPYPPVPAPSAMMGHWPNDPPPPVINSELQILLDELNRLAASVMSSAIRTGGIADRVFGASPESLSDPPKSLDPANLIGGYHDALARLRDHIGRLDHNVERLERL